MGDTIKLESKITHFESINPLFSEVKIRIAYPGLNRNNSYIPKDSFEKALPTLYICPIVGEFNESIEDFRGHGGKLEITDDSIKWVNTTTAYGVIDSSSEITWEDVTEEDGTINEYLCATGYLWTSRFPELYQVIENSKGQSMEIEVVSGKNTEIDGVKCYEITEFVFSGLCILGDDVVPCFESSEIVAYSLDNFKQQFNQMIKELKFSINMKSASSEDDDINVSKEGGKNLDKILEMLQKYNLSMEDVEAKGIKVDDFSLEDLEVKLQEVFKQDEPVTEFSLTHEQLESELRRELSEIETLTEVYWDEIYTSARYCLVDFYYDQSIVVAWDCKEYYLVAFNYTITGDSVEVDESSMNRRKVDYPPMDLSAGDDDKFAKKKFNLTHVDVIEHRVKAKEFELQKQINDLKATNISDESKAELEKVQADFAALQEKFSALEIKAVEMETQLNSIAQEDREIAEDVLFEQFSEKLTEEDMAEVKAKKSELSLEDIKKELALVFAMKNLKFSAIKENKPLRVDIPTDNKPKSDKVYADLIESRSKSV